LYLSSPNLLPLLIERTNQRTEIWRLSYCAPGRFNDLSIGLQRCVGYHHIATHRAAPQPVCRPRATSKSFSSPSRATLTAACSNLQAAVQWRILDVLAQQVMPNGTTSSFPRMLSQSSSSMNVRLPSSLGRTRLWKTATTCFSKDIKEIGEDYYHLF
jgi:hypothetical protein